MDECLRLIDEEAHDQERDAEAERVRDEQEERGAGLRRRQGEDRAEHGPHARAPSDGERRAEDEGGKICRAELPLYPELVLLLEKRYLDEPQ